MQSPVSGDIMKDQDELTVWYSRNLNNSIISFSYLIMSASTCKTTLCSGDQKNPVLKGINRNTCWG